MKSDLQLLLTATHGAEAVLAGVTPGDVTAAEKRLGVTFPGSLREFYSIAGRTAAFAEFLLPLHEVSFDSARHQFALGPDGQWVLSSSDLADGALLFQSCAWRLVRAAPHVAEGRFELGWRKDPMEKFFPQPEQRPQRLGPEGGQYLVYVTPRHDAAIVSYLRGLTAVGATAAEPIAEVGRAMRRSFRTLRPATETKKPSPQLDGEDDKLIQELVRIGKVIGSTLNPSQIDAAVVGVGPFVPRPLRRFLALCGHVKAFMSAYYRFVELPKAKLDEDFVVFCADDRAGVEWAFRAASAADAETDVWLREMGRTAWQQSHPLMSRFLLHHACWQAVMSMPVQARAKIPEKGPKRTAIEKLMPRLAWYRSREENESLLNERRQLVGSVIGGTELYVGGRTADALDEFASDARLELDFL